MVKKIIKILFITLTSLAALIIILVFVIGAGLLNGFVAKSVAEQAGKKLNGELNIGSIDGRLISHFTIRDISIIYGSDTLLYCDELEIDYLLKPLFRKEISLGLIRVNGLALDLRQEADSSWNFMKLLPQGEEEADSSSAEFDWKISLSDLVIRNFTSEIVTLDTSGMIPSRIESGLKLSASMSGDTLNAKVDSLMIKAYNPDFSVNEISGTFSKHGNIILWNDLIVQLTGSRLESQGSYKVDDGAVDARIALSPLDLDDVRSLLPEFQIFGSPDIKVHLKGTEKQYAIAGELAEENQKIGISASLSDFRENPRYTARIEAENIDGSHWTADKELSSDISGVINIEGSGFDIKTNSFKVNAGFKNLRFGEYTAGSLDLESEKNRDRLSGILQSETFAGDIKMDYSLSDVFGNPAYRVLLTYKNVNADNIPGIDSVWTNLNGNLILEGRGLHPDKIVAETIINSESSMIMDQRLGDFTLEGEYNKGDYKFDLRDLGAPYFNLTAEGNGNIKKSNDIRFSLEPLDLTGLLETVGLPAVSLTGKISGNLTGTMDSLNTFINLNLSDIVYDTISVGEITAEINGIMADESISGDLQLNIGNVTAGALSLQTADIAAKYQNNLIEADLKIIIDDSLRTSFSGSVAGLETPIVHISNFGFGYNNLEWSTVHDSASVTLNEEDITINSFSLGSGDQRIDVDGRFAFEGDEDLSVSLSNLELEALPLETMLPYEISGLLNMGLSLEGTAAMPLIAGNIQIDDLEISGFQIDSIRSGISYSDRLLHFTGNIASGLYESINVTADIPVQIAFNDTISLLNDDQGFQVVASIDSLNLEEIYQLFPVESTAVSGFANLNVEVSNSIRNPLISGTFELSDAALNNKKYGAEYSEIFLFVSIDSSTAALDTLHVSSGKGNFSMNGYVSLENTDSISLNDFKMALKASDFQAVESSSIELNFDSDLNLSGTLGNPVFSGDLEINSSKINIDYFSTLFSQKTDEPNQPLLIEALRDTLEISAASDTSSKAPALSGTGFYKSLTGEIAVDIPGNTWVTGKDMNLELEGSLRGVKKDENINLFGDLNVKRGYYKIYGRSFDFERGKITFTGSSEFNPDVDFEIVYNFRDIEKELRDLSLLITGRLMQPDLKFMLDDEALEEKDAISYIAFGKSVNQLGEGEREKFNGQEVAMGAAVSQLSSVLKGVLQESTGVDVFEVTGGEDWKSGSVTIGKYITNNLFLSYDRSFDFNKQSKTADSEKIMLEYQILRNLILKATNQEINSGFDFIWRKTWR